VSLQEINIKRQAESLQRNLKGILHLLEDKYTEFQQMCRVFNPKRGYSPTAARDIKEIYKMTTAKFAEAKALQQVIRGKYRGYVQVDAQLQRTLDELSLMYRKDYRFFEQNHSTWQREQSGREEKRVTPRILSHLYTVYRESPAHPSLILCFQGDPSSLQTLKDRVQLGERDMWDAVEGELWLFMAGVQHSEDPQLKVTLIETLLYDLKGKVKGVVFKVTTGDAVREETLQDMRRGLAGVPAGEIKIL
jgi:hypothetical protein